MTARPTTAPGGPRHLVLVVAGVVALGAAVAPELARYAAERRLATVTGALESIVAGGRVVPEAAPMLERLAATASATAAVNPGDTRGLVAAGAALLVAGRGAEARGYYRAALARGERAEIDLNLARAYALEGRRAAAEAALLRAVWVSPALIATLPSAEQPRLTAALAELTARLQAGALAMPPSLPDDAAGAPTD